MCTLDLHARDYHVPDVGIGDHVGNHLLNADVLGLAGPYQRRSCCQQRSICDVRSAGTDGHGIIGVTCVVLAGDDGPWLRWFLLKSHLQAPPCRAVLIKAIPSGLAKRVLISRTKEMTRPMMNPIHMLVYRPPM